MTPTKQTVLFAFGENGLPLHSIANVEKCMKSYKKETGYFFTPEQLNEYTANVIKQASVEFANWIAYTKKHGGVKPLQEALIQYKLKSTEELFDKYLEMSK